MKHGFTINQLTVKYIVKAVLEDGVGALHSPDTLSTHLQKNPI